MIDIKFNTLTFKIRCYFFKKNCIKTLNMALNIALNMALTNVTAWKVPIFRVILVRISCIRTENGEILRIYPYSVRMRENKDPNNSGYFLRSGYLPNNNNILRKFGKKHYIVSIEFWTTLEFRVFIWYHSIIAAATAQMFICSAVITLMTSSNVKSFW